jgi:hypothetical protein
MTLQRLAGICFCILITPAIATGQPKSNATSPGQQVPAGGVIQAAHEAGAVMPLRRTQTRSTSGAREVIVETVESLDIEGRLAPIDEIVTETRTERNTQHVRQDVFRFTPERRRQLSETTESRQDTQPNGDTGTVHNTWAPDLNGHLRLMSRRTEQTTSSAPDVRQTTTTLLVPHINESLRETERSEHTARRVTPGVVQHQSTHLVRDINGRWTPVEIRRSEVRELVGTSEQIEEETIQYPDLNGTFAVAETNVIRRSKTNDQEHVVIETYDPATDRWPRAHGGSLSQRVQRTTTATADGGRSTVEEVEARSPVAPDDPMRVIRRTVTTVRPISADRWVTERQVFEPDLEGRLQLVRNE